MTATVKELAALVDGRLDGDGEVVVSAACPLDDDAPGAITFVDNPKHFDRLLRSRVSAAVVGEAMPLGSLPLIRVADPLMAFVAIYRHLHRPPELPSQGIDARASVHESASIGTGASVKPFAVIGPQTAIGARCRIGSGAVIGAGCRLGDDVTIHANAVIYDGTVVGSRVVIHASSVIGADGFGYRLKDGKHEKVPQLGIVEIGDDVEIGAGVTIDRATFGATRIGMGTKIDNQVQIGHNCRIGKHNILVSQVGISGSCGTGDYVVMAGQVGIADHIDIGSGAIIGAKSGVSKDVPSGERMFGYPATPMGEQKRILMAMRELPQLRKELLRLKRQMGPGKAE